nr:alanine--tRNA ligase [Tanacetum cinerariifolium]
MMMMMMTSQRGGNVDPGWEHGTPQDDKKKKVRCNYCAKVVSGGIYRLKQHLARLSGEVTYCDKAPQHVSLQMKLNLQQRCTSSSSINKPRKQQYHLDDYLNDDYFQQQQDQDEEQEEEYIINITAPPPPPLRSLGYVDPGWEHGIPRDDRKKKVKCNYCDKIVSGGINRFKQHLARIPGEVAPCKSAPEDVYLKIKENMKWHRTGRRHRRPEQTSSSSAAALYMMHSENEQEYEYDDDSDRLLITDGNKRKRFAADSTRPEPMSKKSSKSRKEVMSAISKFFYHAGVPAHAADSPYFHKMLEMVGQYGQDLPAPNSRMLSGRFLQDEMLTINTHLAEYKASWAVTGCSILADTWKDAHNKTLINFLVSCPRGLHFISSVDATDFVEDAPTLFNILDNLVDEMGEENVVQVITQNTPSYQAAGKMLEEKRQNLFWTPCAASCIEQMLHDFSKLKWVAECIEKAQKITKLVYNQIWLLNVMKREYTGGQEVVRPYFTVHASCFLTLESLMEHRIALKHLFQSTKWLSSRVSKSEEGQEVEKIVLNATFWKKVQYIRRSVSPILQVLQKINGDDENLSMAYIYNDMFKAKFEIKCNHGDDTRKYGNICSIIDNNWNSSLGHPLYLAAYFLNPSYRYRPDFVLYPEVVRGLNSCIVRFEPNNARRVSASKQISDFGSAKADFGTELAINTRTEVNPAAWWQQHGIHCLELQQMAIRILSQTCSSFGCEHSWSVYDEIHNRRHNHLAQKRLNNFVYVHYNLRLRERQIRQIPNTSVSLDTVLQENVLFDWIVKPEKKEYHEEEEELSEMEQGDDDDAYQNGLLEYEGHGTSKKGSLQLTGMQVQPLDVHCPNNIKLGAVGVDQHHDEDEDDLNFLDDGLSD